MWFPNISTKKELKLYKSKAGSAAILSLMEFRTTWGSSAPCQVNLLLLEIPVCSCPDHTRSCRKGEHLDIAASSSL